MSANCRYRTAGLAPETDLRSFSQKLTVEGYAKGSWRTRLGSILREAGPLAASLPDRPLISADGLSGDPKPTHFFIECSSRYLQALQRLGYRTFRSFESNQN